MSAYPRVRLEGCVRVALAAAEAFELFTPRGERRWADGWDPWFPALVQDETEPGTVFATTHDDVTTTWIAVARDRPRSIAYANVSEAGRAAMVRVSCEPEANGTTTATVTYDITALSETGAAWLHEFAAGYRQYLEHWEHAIAAALAG